MCAKMTMFSVFSLLALTVFVSTVVSVSSNDTGRREPTVMVAIFARNKAHTLPYYLTLLEQLDYPKDRISLWIRSDHNEDRTLEILRKWIFKIESDYHSVHYDFMDSPPYRFDDETGPVGWTKQRFNHIIQLRQEALDAARNLWADFIWYLDCDVFLTNPQTLHLLVSKGHTVVAPKLNSLGLYSNYWCGMSEDYYYQRTEEYLPILDREKTGCFEVKMVHSAVLVDLRSRSSLNLTYVSKNVPGYAGPSDDIIVFALSAKANSVPLVVCNDEVYGFVPVPLESGSTLEEDYTQLTSVKLEVLVWSTPLPVDAMLKEYTWLPEKSDTLGFDAVFVINLERRNDRKEKMLECIRELGIDATFVPAVDGKKLNDSVLDEMGIKLLPEYKDPYHKRSMKFGEIGCFLSHYNIWREMVVRGHQTAVVLEDDIRFESYFRQRMNSLMAETEKLKLEWDLIYLGRKRLVDRYEPWVDGSQQLVWVDYSYWTLGYIITQVGAKKLLAADPLSKMIPVDEYLPIMFDRHPETVYKEYFPTRDLRAFSVSPLFLYPTRYLGQDGYVSDTEDSSTVNFNSTQECSPSPPSISTQQDTNHASQTRAAVPKDEL